MHARPPLAATAATASTSVPGNADSLLSQVAPAQLVTAQLVTAEIITAEAERLYPGGGVVCHEIGPDWALATRLAHPSDIRPGEYISGPTQFAVADHALWFLSFVVLGRIEPMAVTSELSIRYLRPAKGTHIWAKATLDSVGRRQMVGSVRVWAEDQFDRPSSIAQGTYVFPAER